jgi:glyoxylase-like metal-dependent hydrolase (beta-lactamase superfamily II)
MRSLNLNRGPLVGLVAAALMAAVPLNGRADEFRVREPTSRAQSATDRAPVYRIYPLRNGICGVAGDHAFVGGDPEKTYGYALYVWLILGGEKPILVDAGLNDVAEMNRGAARVLREPIVQPPDETVRAQLAHFGLTPADIGHIFVTHLHFDHVDGVTDFPNAIIHIGRKEWDLATANDCRGSWGHGRIMFTLRDDPDWNRRLHLVEDEEVLPGIESFWVGGHTLGSMAYRVNTAYGRVVLTGDTVSLLENITRDVPVGVNMNVDECMTGMQRIREKADIVLPSHDPGTIGRWPPLPEGTPRYSIRAVKVGDCQVRDSITFQGSSSDETRTYNLYVWLIEGGEKPILVETGPNPRYVEEFNRGTARYIPGGVQQTPEEDTLVALKRLGIEPGDVSHVIATHTHADHYDYFDAFTSARLVLNKVELEDNLCRLNPDVLEAITTRRGALQVVCDGEEIVPGIRSFRLGCHTDGSQGVLVQTWIGPVMLTGDVVYLYENIETNHPGNSPDPQACLDAMARIRSLADLVLPAHDPLTLERWPDGVIGARPRKTDLKQGG